MKLVVPFERSFDATYGLEYIDPAHGRVVVGARHLGAHGAVQSGVYASMAESLAVAGTQASTGRAAVGHSSQTSFLRPITDGTVHATGRPRHRGRSTWVWEFDVTDDEARLCALVRMTVSVRDAV